jgi:hypothetical protein
MAAKQHIWAVPGIAAKLQGRLIRVQPGEQQFSEFGGVIHLMTPASTHVERTARISHLVASATAPVYLC